MIRICPEQGNEGIITATTVVGETVTVYCGERTVEYSTWAEMVTDITNSFWELALSSASRRMKVPAPSEPSHMAWHWAFQNGQKKQAPSSAKGALIRLGYEIRYESGNPY